MIQEGLYSLLANNGGVRSLINGRVYPVLAPDDLAQYPCISYSCVGGSVAPTLDTSGVLRQRVELNALAQDYATAANIREAIVAAINGYQGRLDDGTRILNTVLLNPGTDFCSDQRVFRCMAEFYFFYTLPR